jgi:hypothetical protein
LKSMPLESVAVTAQPPQYRLASWFGITGPATLRPRKPEGKTMRHECLSLELFEERDWRGEAEGIRKCGEHVYEFTRLDDGTFMVTHQFAGGEVEVLKSGVRGGTCYKAVMQHHRAMHEASGQPLPR